MAVVEIGETVVGAWIEIVDDAFAGGGCAAPGGGNADVTRTRQRVGDPAAPSIRISLVDADLERVVIGVEVIARLELEHALEIRAARLRGNQFPVGSNTAGPGRPTVPFGSGRGSLMSMSAV